MDGGRGLNNIFDQHPVKGILDAILEFESKGELFTPQVAANPPLVRGRDQTFLFSRIFRQALGNTPSLLLSQHHLAVLNGVFQSIHNELVGFVGSGNLTHLSNLAAYVDQSVPPLLWMLVTAKPSLASNAANEQLEVLTAAVNQTIASLESKYSGAADALDRANSGANDLQRDIQSLAMAVSAQKNDAQATVASLNTQFADDQRTRAEEFAEQLRGDGKKFEMFVLGSQNDASVLLEKLRRHENDARRIVQAVGDVGITGNFQIVANRENIQANIWRLVTLGFFSLGVLLAVMTFLKFYDSNSGDNGVLSVFVRLLFALAIAVPAWYTAKESARHRTNSDRARQSELELAALGPFIELMPDDKQVAIREALTQRYFGRSVEEHVPQTPLSSKDLKDVLVAAIDALKK